MGEILGLGTTHYPPLVVKDEYLTNTFRLILSAPKIEARYKDRANWPAGMIAELGEDEGLTAAKRYRARLADDFRQMRKILDDFKPDFVVIFGDDQYENFKEDIIPPFCVYGLDDEIDLKPWLNNPITRMGGQKVPNGWDEPDDFPFKIKGHREGAKYLTDGLIKHGVDMPYAYKTLHLKGLAVAFTHTLLYLDWDRKGFPYPVIPFHVNCYGSSVITAKGGLAHLFQDLEQKGLPDPSGPSPWRCMEVGAKVAQTLAASPWRVALLASSSWSHCFLSSNSGYLWPDQESDRLMLEALRRGDYDFWRKRTTAEIEAAGHQEMLNWMVLVGAMEELGRKAVIHDYVETYIFQSEKCFASFPPS